MKHRIAVIAFVCCFAFLFSIASFACASTEADSVTLESLECEGFTYILLDSGEACITGRTGD